MGLRLARAAPPCPFRRRRAGCAADVRSPPLHTPTHSAPRASQPFFAQAGNDYDESMAAHNQIKRNQPLHLKLGAAIKDISGDELMARWTSKKKGEISKM
eukprot:110751-Prymnesium_polylepis.1